MNNIPNVLEKGGFRIKEWLTSRHFKTQQLNRNEDQYAVQLLTGARVDRLCWDTCSYICPPSWLPKA